uniref:Uncharacterized protein n=1 Tax=Monodelphis domestica TaxID=13616 RepID=A0A5F8HHP3_MONDO
INMDQISAFAQQKQNFVHNFSQMAKILTEDGMGHPGVEDAMARLKIVLKYSTLGEKEKTWAFQLCNITIVASRKTRSSSGSIQPSVSA